MFIESSIEKIIEFIKDKVVHDLLPIRPGRNVQIIKTKLIETLYLVFVMKAIKWIARYYVFCYLVLIRYTWKTLLKNILPSDSTSVLNRSKKIQFTI